ncbi:pyridoxal phosphate-dependent decarboxylase family protein [Streptomyces sp. GS7]|uniref:pyridoxal phosphate-dependent decarboxylase family protein n=1 Tax=Streptomyces sp. GS7 TaxID=2692234 RepID=UPI0013163170|nr:pyridoxal-dependent decarboxylase [Streptomyces sp. GS7]QHC23791.1 aspartate aminotransferase family protein [Streptomyces sp. GS7]
MGDEFEAAIETATRQLVAHWRALAAREVPVSPPCEPGSLLTALPSAPPEQAEGLGELLADTWKVIVPGLTHWQHPAFLGYFPTNNSPASVLAEYVTAGLGVQGMMWSTSPAATELEQVVTDWLAQALGLPEAFRHSSGRGGGVIQDSASSAVLVAIAAALQRASEGRWRTAGTEGRYRMYFTERAHSCVSKGARLAGLGEPQLIATLPGTGRMDPDALGARIDADRAAGFVPAIVVATVGTTDTCAVDPVPDIGRLCRREDVWLHVDAAYAGSATLCPEHRHLIDGVALADSYAVNAHKWMRTGTPCDVMWTSDRAALTDAMSISPSYLRNAATDSGRVVDFRDWQVPLGRPMRALKLWYVMRAHGLEGLREAIRHDIRLAAQLARLITAEPGFHLEVHELGLVVFRRDTDDHTRDLLSRLQADRTLLCTPTSVEGRPAVRAAFGSPYVDADTLHYVWTRIRTHAQGLETPSASPS